MRLVSWNVCDAFERKFGHLERLAPDIAVLQEVRPACLAFAGLSARSLWLGDEGQKGLAVVAYGDWRLEPGPRVDERWFLPVVARRGDERAHIVGVWADSATPCGPPTLRALDALDGFLAAAPSCLAGDFNQSVALDGRKGAGRRFRDVLDVLEARGFESAWHGQTGEAHGAETGATLYWTWNAERRFHIDYAFASPALTTTDVRLGDFDTYVAGRISDHVPLVVDFKMGGLPA